MVIRRILTADEPILHEKTKKVTDFDVPPSAPRRPARDDADAPGSAWPPTRRAPLQVAVIEIEGKITELVNPKVVRRSGKTVDWEGCLSIPGFVAEVERSTKVTVQARDRNGREFRVKGDELFARALQHEIDHLNGILYIDYLESLEELVRVSEASEEVREEAAAGSSARPDRVPGQRRVRRPAPRAAPGARRRAARRQPTDIQPAGRGLRHRASPVAEAARTAGLPLLTLSRLRTDEARRVAEFKPDGLLLVSYGELVPADLLSLAPRPPLNVHPSSCRATGERRRWRPPSWPATRRPESA